MAPPIFPASTPMVFVCALADEAKHFSLAIKNNVTRTIAKSQASVKVVQTGLGAERINEKLTEILIEPPAVMIIAGTAGSLNSDYTAGDIIVISSAVDENGDTLPLSSEWTKTLQSAFSSLHPKLGIGFTSPSAVTSAIEKSALHNNFSADCVDMETATVIRFARKNNIPVAAFRIIVDPYNQSVPPAALAGLRADGTTDAMAVAFSLLKRPGHLPPDVLKLLALGRQYRRAMKTLSCAAELLTHFISTPPASETLNHDNIG